MNLCFCRSASFGALLTYLLLQFFLISHISHKTAQAIMDRSTIRTREIRMRSNKNLKLRYLRRTLPVLGLYYC